MPVLQYPAGTIMSSVKPELKVPLCPAALGRQTGVRFLDSRLCSALQFSVRDMSSRTRWVADRSLLAVVSPLSQ